MQYTWVGTTRLAGDHGESYLYLFADRCPFKIGFADADHTSVHHDRKSPEKLFMANRRRPSVATLNISIRLLASDIDCIRALLRIIPTRNPQNLFSYHIIIPLASTLHFSQF